MELVLVHQYGKKVTKNQKQRNLWIGKRKDNMSHNQLAARCYLKQLCMKKELKNEVRRI